MQSKLTVSKPSVLVWFILFYFFYAKLKVIVTGTILRDADGWMLGFYISFNIISVISEGWKGKHERLCAMKFLLGSERISPAAGFEPRAP